VVHLLAFLLSFHIAHAEGKKLIQSGQQITITYGSVSWNTNSLEVDTASLVIRDKASGKIAIIQLEETEPDSSQFRGKFSLTFTDGAGAAPEVFVPPSELRKGTDTKKLYALVQSGQLTRKPVISRKTDKGPMLDVYDTREQADIAMKAYQDEMALQKQKLVKAVPTDQEMDTVKLAAMNSLAMDASKRESERIRMVQIEHQRMLEKMRTFATLSDKQKDTNRTNARILADQAMKNYLSGEFKLAEDGFGKAINLDPNTNEYIYKYGLSLYRTEKYNEALVELAVAKDEPATALEKKYFTALIHLRLKEYNQALVPLEQVAATKDAGLAPSAMYYKGVVQFELERYEDSKKSFEDVIDISNDPTLDQTAENYLDRIAAAIAMREFRKKKFTLTATGGLMYDTNVKLSQDADALSGFGTKQSDFKLMLAGDLEYRAVYTDVHEWSVDGAVNLSQASKTELQYTDPWIYSISAPYNNKGVLFNKGYKFTAKPGYDILNMGEGAGDTSKKNIQNSQYINVDNTFVMRPDWFSIYSLEYRMDDTKLASAIGASDSDANKISLKTAQLFFLDAARKEAIIGTAGYVMNNAKGDDKKYNRIELGALYMRPVLQDSSLAAGLNYYTADYNKAAIDRTDTNLSISSSLTRAWSETVTMALTGVYSVNSSNLSANEYNKFMVMTTATFKTNF
jgi:tetratricopeptide (TPR) repeat protein